MPVCGVRVTSEGGEMATGSNVVASPNTELGEEDLAELIRVPYYLWLQCRIRKTRQLKLAPRRSEGI